MKRLLLALVLAAATSGTAFAQTVPPPGPPPGRPTANLILDAMLATARAASVNPGAAQSASLNTSVAIQRYNMGDVNGARSAAIQALIEANRMPQTSIPVLAVDDPADQLSADATVPDRGRQRRGARRERVRRAGARRPDRVPGAQLAEHRRGVAAAQRRGARRKGRPLSGRAHRSPRRRRLVRRRAAAAQRPAAVASTAARL